MADKRLLLVEGANDKHVILAIQGRRGIRLLDSEKKEFMVCDDVGRLLSSLPIQLKGSDIAQLGVVVDADVNPSNRWTELRSILLAAGYADVPQTPSAQGTIVEAPTDSILPRVGIWLMPDNKSPGILEDFLQFLVPANCGLFSHAQTVVSTLPEKKFSPVAEPKALVHTWLAWQEDPGRPLGQSITARYLDAGVPEVDVFVEWLRRLFDAPQ
jgi:hypothetical protein